MPIATLYKRVLARVLSSETEKESRAPNRAPRARDANLPSASTVTKRPEPDSHTEQDCNRDMKVVTGSMDHCCNHNGGLNPVTARGACPSDLTGSPLAILQTASPHHQQLGSNKSHHVRDTNTMDQTAHINFYSTSGTFANANNPVFYGPVNMYDTVQSTHPLLQQLAEKAKHEAIHDSSYREYPPRCSENTRISLRKDIVEWRGNPKRQKRMRWYMGPAAIGKSAIAQSVAEELERTGHLGGSFFFSRPGKIDDPATVIPTLAYQLAMKNDPYKQVVAKLLADDPLLLTKNRSIQFNKLIIEPFQNIALQYNSANDSPMLIILDGLDECKGKEAQCELIHLVLDHVGRFREIPLLWLVFSRPEWHLKTIASDVDFPAACEKMEISVDDEEAQEDTRRLLEAELTKIRRQYFSYLPEDWPPREDVDRLCRAASGHLGFASFMARFIRDTEVGDPEKQFQICTRIASGLGVDQGTRINPLDALDHLYYRILSEIPPDILPTTMLILGQQIRYPGYPKFARDQANLLNLTQASYTQALKQLHSVLYAPLPSEASTNSLRFYHTSFIDFLRDPVRSGKFHLDQGTIRFNAAVYCLRWLNKHSEQPADADDPVFRFAWWAAWNACPRVSKELLPKLLDELALFDFGNLRDPHLGNFTEFIYWLYTTAPPNNSLIKLIDEPPKANVRTLIVEYTPYSESDFRQWASVFFPDRELERSSHTLHFLLGTATQLHVHFILH